MNNRRLYVLTRKDLDHSVQAVQAGHVVAEFCLLFPNEWNNEYLIYLTVPNEQALENWIWKIGTKKDSPNIAVFKEPDLDYQITALAIVDDGKLFKKLELL